MLEAEFNGRGQFAKSRARIVMPMLPSLERSGITRALIRMYFRVFLEVTKGYLSQDPI